MSWNVYILLSETHRKTYVGFTGDLEKRIKEHNKCRVPYTSKFAPWRLIYAEKFLSESEAQKKEKYFKSRTGRMKIKKIMTELGINE